jgi:hypothetical protein
MKTPKLRKSVGRSPLRLGLPRVQRIWIIRGFFLIPLVLGCFALSPTVRAVSPAPDGGYPNGNTAEGDSALETLSTGENNTAIGFETLFFNHEASNNTATGHSALFNNTGNNNTATGSFTLQSNTTGGQIRARVLLFSRTTR